MINSETVHELHEHIVAELGASDEGADVPSLTVTLSMPGGRISVTASGMAYLPTSSYTRVRSISRVNAAPNWLDISLARIHRPQAVHRDRRGASKTVINNQSR